IHRNAKDLCVQLANKDVAALSSILMQEFRFEAFLIGILVTFHEHIVNVYIRWNNMLTHIHDNRTPPRKSASLPQVFLMFQFSQGNRCRPAFPGVCLWDGITQELRVWMPRIHQYLFHATHLNNVAAEHDCDTIADIISRRQVMCDIEDTYP